MGDRLSALRDAVIAACRALGCTPNELVGWPSLDDEQRDLEERIDEIREERRSAPPGAIEVRVDPILPPPRQAADPTQPRRGMSPERDARIRELCEAGATAREIGDAVGLTYAGAIAALKRLGLTATRQRRPRTLTGT